MSDAPERIWVEEPEVFDGMGFWQETQSAGLKPYARADLLTVTLARAEAMEAAAKTAREDALREAASVAANACLVDPDGGNPTEAERLVCEEAYRRILALIDGAAT